MSDTQQLNPWLWWLPAGIPARLAPDRLNQPILPGWTFAGVVVNAQNSSAPGTERAIVSEHSYGRQLGRITDVLQQLIEERPAGAPTTKALRDFEAMEREIAAIKAEASRDRVDRLLDDIEELKRSSPSDYARLAKALRGAA